MTPLLPHGLVVLDTETTGLPSASWSRVVELAAVLLDTQGREVDTFTSLVRPDILDARAAGAQRIHGITPAMLADAPDAAQVVADFRAWIATAIPVTAFNVAFDRPMTERMGLTGLRWAHCIMLRSLDIMGPAGVLAPADPSHPRYVPGREWLWPSLAAASEFFGVPAQEPAHRALSDARRAAAVAVEVRRRMQRGAA